MSSKKILVLISGSGSNLQAIIDQVHLSDELGNIVAVISNKAEAYGLERATNAGIATSVVASKGITDRAQYDQALISEIDKYQPDLIVMAGFMRILTPAFVQHYAGKMLNIHPSLLPKYQGLNTHQRAIDAKDEEHGASVHFVTEELDGGPVILQAKVPVFSEDQAEDLAARVQDQEHRIYPLAVKWFINNRLSMQNGKAVLDGAELPEPGYAND
ncbi:phosphoribosylglycinamide formyltransferase [Motilimonas sp. 1_MG-2023]|uniref:phosphoribosylglycinamide formyltransferase n=1 Tax=Motilimonas sp. 1_MG-2023 TaxID=3062672 RepID=UPI0026E4238D|nr:phosphoribosylglycinamide formyltransferase [Motilimonas sp. 1_MG-2023]MDO6525173.1 phosphoribosylglycinamide formyltransferase [Motilimonas sp. 1_MG-2023]